MDILGLVNSIKKSPDCVVYPPLREPSITSPHVVPLDLAYFYKLCGGIDLFTNSVFPISLSSPEGLLQANPVIFTGVSNEQLNETKNDISWSWYIIGKGPNSQYITIDLSQDRLGKCYDSFWDKHPRDSKVIALSFTDLVNNLLIHRGETYYWKAPGYVYLGSPY